MTSLLVALAPLSARATPLTLSIRMAANAANMTLGCFIGHSPFDPGSKQHMRAGGGTSRSEPTERQSSVLLLESPLVGPPVLLNRKFVDEGFREACRNAARL